MALSSLYQTWTATQERPPTLTAFLFQLSSPLRRHWHTRVRVLFRQLAPTMQSTSSFAHLSLPPLSPHAFLAASDDFLLLFGVCLCSLFAFLLTHATPHRSSWPRCLFLYPGRPSRQHRCTWGLVSRMGIITLMTRVCVLVSMTTTIPLLKPSSLPRTIMPSAVLFVSSGTHPLTHIHTHIHR